MDKQSSAQDAGPSPMDGVFPTSHGEAAAADASGSPLAALGSILGASGSILGAIAHSGSVAGSPSSTGAEFGSAELVDIDEDEDESRDRSAPGPRVTFPEDDGDREDGLAVYPATVPRLAKQLFSAGKQNGLATATQQLAIAGSNLIVQNRHRLARVSMCRGGSRGYCAYNGQLRTSLSRTRRLCPQCFRAEMTFLHEDIQAERQARVLARLEKDKANAALRRREMIEEMRQGPAKRAAHR